MIDRARPRPPTASRAITIAFALAIVESCGAPTVIPAREEPASTDAEAAEAMLPSAGGTPPTFTAPPAPTRRTLRPPIDPEAAPPRSNEPAPGSGRFAKDLYRRGDFVSQATTAWCVPAAILTMLNMIDGSPRHRRPSQRTLDRMAWSLSSERLIRPGSEPEGWAGALNRLGVGRYMVAAKATRHQALRAAARAIRLTRRPVGLLVWHGSHAWVMTGFQATADPARASTFRVTSIRVSDPWYPRPSAAWGRVRAPDTRMSPVGLAKVYLRWHRPIVRYAELDDRFVLVLPVARPAR
jgi:hypothetical protein